MIAMASLNTCKAEIHISCGTPKLQRPNTPSFLHLLLWLLSSRTVHQSQGHQATWLPRKIAVCSLLLWSISWSLCMWLNTWSYPGMSDKRKCFPFLTRPQILHLFSISICKNTFFLKKRIFKNCPQTNSLHPPPHVDERLLRHNMHKEQNAEQDSVIKECRKKRGKESPLK